MVHEMETDKNEPKKTNQVLELETNDFNVLKTVDDRTDPDNYSIVTVKVKKSEVNFFKQLCKYPSGSFKRLFEISNKYNDMLKTKPSKKSKTREREDIEETGGSNDPTYYRSTMAFVQENIHALQL